MEVQVSTNEFTVEVLPRPLVTNLVLTQVLPAYTGLVLPSRWIEGLPIEDDPILSAPELGPVADTITLYEAATKMRMIPIGRRSLLAVLLPAALPLLPVLAIEVPIGDLLMKVVKTLV